MTTRLPVALLNFDGGLVRPSRGVYDFDRLRRLLTPLVANPPALLVLLEAKEYGLWGEHGLFGAANAMTDVLGCPFEGRLGWSERGLFGPALFYNPARIRLSYWGGAHQTVPDDKRNSALLSLSGSSQQCRVVLQQWDHHSGDRRLDQAKLVAHYGHSDMPTLLAGGLNSTAGSPHLPERNWSVVPAGHRSGKGWQPDGPGTPWQTDTRAVDQLIGQWTNGSRRTDSSGWAAVCELAAAAGMPPQQAFAPTVNTGIDAGGGLLIDWLLVNRAWQERFPLVADSYTVHVPPGTTRAELDSDHRLVTAAFHTRVTSW